eukprot:jgi/Tetstr1/455237/TSEL_042084.t1
MHTYTADMEAAQREAPADIEWLDMDGHHGIHVLNVPLGSPWYVHGYMRRKAAELHEEVDASMMSKLLYIYQAQPSGLRAPAAPVAARGGEASEELAWFSGIGLDCVAWPEGKRPDALTAASLVQAFTRDGLREELVARGAPRGQSTKAALASKLMKAVELELEEVLALEIAEEFGEERAGDEALLQQLKDDLLDNFLGLSASAEDGDTGEEELVGGGGDVTEEAITEEEGHEEEEEEEEEEEGDGEKVAEAEELVEADLGEAEDETALLQMEAEAGRLPDEGAAGDGRAADAGGGGGGDAEVDCGGQHMNVMLLATPDITGSPFLSSNAMLSMMNEVWAFNAGEDLQRQIHSTDIRNGQITRIFVSSMAPNHVLGLQGLLCTISSANQTGDRPAGQRGLLQLVGPPGLAAYVDCVMSTSKTFIAMPVDIYEMAPGALAPHETKPEPLTRRAKLTRIQVPPDQVNPEGPTDAAHGLFAGKVNSRELKATQDVRRQGPASTGGFEAADELTWTFACDGGYVVTAAACVADTPTFAFCVEEPRKVGKVDVEASDALGIPRGKMLAQLKAGESIEVVGPDRPGRKVVIVAECTAPGAATAELAKGCDLLLYAAQNAPDPSAPMQRSCCSAEAGRFAKAFHFDRFGKNDDLSDSDRAALEAASAAHHSAAAEAFGHRHAVASGFDQFQFSVPRREGERPRGV